MKTIKIVFGLKLMKKRIYKKIYLKFKNKINYI